MKKKAFTAGNASFVCLRDKVHLLFNEAGQLFVPSRTRMAVTVVAEIGAATGIV